MKLDTCTLKVFRGQPGKQYWEEFVLPFNAYDNVISLLLKVQKNPINSKGEKVDPVVWEDGCLEEVCGSCSMLVNGKPAQACVSLVKNLLVKEGGKPVITLAPFSKFPLVRDLMVDRSSMFENLKKVQAWIENDKKEGAGPQVSQKDQELMYALSRCMTCGCCTEACPNVNKDSTYMGPAPLAQVRLFTTHPLGKKDSKERLKRIMEEGGISGCGFSENCQRVCPKSLPLAESISSLHGKIAKKFFWEKVFKKKSS